MTESNDIFPETNWSMVRSATADSSASLEALNELCSRYRQPVVKLIPRFGFPAAEAEDLAHDYFADLLRRDYLGDADRDCGRFRAFISQDLKLFLSNVRRKQSAQKRGGGSAPLSLDQLKEDAGFDPADAEFDSIDAYFDRQWALETVRQAREKLAESYRRRSEEKSFQLLSRGLVEEVGEADYAAWASELGKGAGAVKVSMHRMRDRFRRALEDRVRETVSSEEDFAIEMAHLRESLS